MAPYRGGVIGLGWMGLLADLAHRSPDRYHVDDIDRPTPPLDIHRRFPHHRPEVPHTWAEVMWERPEVELVAGADRDTKRLRAFGQRYGLDALYTDAAEMLRREKLDIVAIATNTKGRAELTCLAAACGAAAIATEKPMAHTLAEADRMVQACARAGIPLCCGATPVNHPAYAQAKALLQGGAIGELLSIEAEAPASQKAHWAYFVEAPGAWVVGSGDPPPQGGSNEFKGGGLLVTQTGLCVHFRRGPAWCAWAAARAK